MRRVRWTALLAGLLLLNLLVPVAWSAEPPAPWTLASTVPTIADDPLVQVLHDGERYVALSSLGMFLTSPDGITWEGKPLGLDSPAAAFAVGDGRTVVLTREMGSDTQIQAFNSFYVYKNGSFVQKVRGPVGVRLHSLWYSGNRFLAQGEHTFTQDMYAYISTDGLDWTERGAAVQESPMVVGQEGSYTYGYANFYLYRSTRPSDWRSVGGIPRDQLPARVTAAAYGNGRWVAIGLAADGTFWIRYSTDGTTWKSPDLAGVTFTALIHAGGNFIAVGDNLYAVSRDGATWAVQPSPVGGLQSLVYARGRITAVGEKGVVAQGRLGDLVRHVGYKPVVPTPAMTGAQCAGLKDMLATDPACPAVATLMHMNAVSGFPDLTFRPDEQVTRAAFAKMLVLALERRPEPTAPASFSDVQGHWAVQQGYIQAAVSMGAMGGFPGGTFQPDEPVTRAQMVKATMASAGLRVTPATGFYQDIASTWYEGRVADALGGRLLGPGARHKVFTDPSFRGDQPATRAETAMLLANLFD